MQKMVETNPKEKTKQEKPEDSGKGSFDYVNLMHVY
jgi:hypothetical protein